MNYVSSKLKLEPLCYLDSFVHLRHVGLLSCIMLIFRFFTVNMSSTTPGTAPISFSTAPSTIFGLAHATASAIAPGTPFGTSPNVSPSTSASAASPLVLSPLSSSISRFGAFSYLRAFFPPSFLVSSINPFSIMARGKKSYYTYSFLC